MTHERVRTNYITVGRYCALLGLNISLLYGQGYIRTVMNPLIEGYQSTVYFIIIHYRV